MKIHILSTFLFLIMVKLMFGQDVHFSNYYASPLSLNPANTGNYTGNWRAMSIYRQQGDNIANSYSTASLAYDQPVYLFSEKASVGLIYIYDNSSNNTLLVNKIYLSGAYFQRITEKSYLHIGLQAGFVHKRFSLNDLTLPDQFDMNTGYFNSQIQTQEYFENHSLYYVDLNWGLIWSRKAQNLSTEIGVAMFHYNTPEEMFFNSKIELSPRYQIHGMAKMRFLDNLYVKPQTLFTIFSNTHEFLIGSDVGLSLSEQKDFNDFHVGIHYRGGFNRISDAMIFKTGFNYGDFDFAIAYDLAISGQKLSNFISNAFEISLIFTRPETKIRERTIPCDIF